MDFLRVYLLAWGNDLSDPGAVVASPHPLVDVFGGRNLRGAVGVFVQRCIFRPALDLEMRVGCRDYHGRGIYGGMHR